MDYQYFISKVKALEKKVVETKNEKVNMIVEAQKVIDELIEPNSDAIKQTNEESVQMKKNKCDIAVDIVEM